MTHFFKEILNVVDSYRNKCRCLNRLTYVHTIHCINIKGNVLKIRYLKNISISLELINFTE